MRNPRKFPAAALAASALLAAGSSLASSHREAPFITTSPKVDASDFYMFRSYEGVGSDGTGGRGDYVTMIANYQPLQGPYGGADLFPMGPNAPYEVHNDKKRDAPADPTLPV